MDILLCRDKCEEIQEASSLRWVANQFPHIENAEDDVARMMNCINLYCSRGADLIEDQKKKIDNLVEEQENLKNHIKEVQVQTISKFAQMLRERKYGGTYPYVLLLTVDEIEQEMVGEVK